MFDTSTQTQRPLTPAAQPQRMLTLLYLANHIVQNGRNKPSLGEAFGEVLGDAMTAVGK